MPHLTNPGGDRHITSDNLPLGEPHAPTGYLNLTLDVTLPSSDHLHQMANDRTIQLLLWNE